MDRHYTQHKEVLRTCASQFIDHTTHCEQWYYIRQKHPAKSLSCAHRTRCNTASAEGRHRFALPKHSRAYHYHMYRRRQKEKQGCRVILPFPSCSDRRRVRRPLHTERTHNHLLIAMSPVWMGKQLPACSMRKSQQHQQVCQYCIPPPPYPCPTLSSTLR